MSDQDLMLLYFVVAWLLVVLIWFSFVKWVLHKLFPDDASLSNDGSADPNSSGADRRDTF